MSRPFLKIDRKYLLDRVEMIPGCGCWIWTGALTSWGYGKIGAGKKTQRAHRVSWELFIGPIPDDMNVLHRCDTPSCINPDHLFLGTFKDNTQDCIRKGRFRTDIEPTKEIEERVRKIRSMRYLKARFVAFMFGVHENTIRRIWSGDRWKSVS